jgi:AraC-like DNA-binding protein
MLNLILPVGRFERHIAIMLVFCMAHGVTLLCDIDVPLGLLYGPLVYLSTASGAKTDDKYAYWHIFPFLLYLFVFILLSFGLEFSMGWVSELKIYYTAGYSLSMPISLIAYCIAIVSGASSDTRDTDDEKLAIRLCVINAALAVFMIFFAIKALRLHNNLNLNLSLYVLLGITFCVLSYYLVNKMLARINAGIVSSDEDKAYGLYHRMSITTDATTLRIKNLENSGLYLNASLTLEMLSVKTGVPKHQLSNHINTCLHATFYQIVAAYRVEFAKKRLQENDGITIEALAYECGFYSKTSLNKYFKEFTGIAPSQYRLGKMNNMAIYESKLSLR